MKSRVLEKMVLKNYFRIKETWSFVKETVSFYKKLTLTLFKLMLAFFTIIFLPCFFEMYVKKSFDPVQNVSVTLCLIVCFLLSVTLLLLPKNKSRYLFFGIFCFLFFIWNFIQIGHLILFNETITYSSVLTMLNTDPRIAAEFVEYSFNWRVFVGLLVSLMPFLWLEVINVPYRINVCLEVEKMSSARRYVIVPFLFMLSVCGLVIYDNIVRFPFYNSEVAAAYDDVRDFAERSKKMQTFDLSDIKTAYNNEEQLHVIIIGESAYRREMSLYGGPVKTTPFVDGIKDNLYVFDNVTSPSAQTAIVITRMLTFSENQFDRSKMWSEPALIDFYNAAGFETYWISAHSMYGLFDNYSHLLQRVKHVSFINKFRRWNRGFDGYKIDENLLPELDKTLADDAKKKVIFIHLMGSHRLYEDRYPEHYQEDNSEFDFSGQKVDVRYVSYLKSLHYTDWMLSQIFARVQNYPEASSYILYLSDHAESVSPYNDEYRHADVYKDPRSLEIPFFVWFSDAYKKENAEFMKTFDSYLHRPYELTWFLHSILDLSRISHPKVDQTKSLFNPDFKGFGNRQFEKWQQQSNTE